MGSAKGCDPRQAGLSSGGVGGKAGKGCLFKDQGLERAKRLRSNTLFKTIFKQGTGFKDGSFVIISYPNSYKVCRLGVSAKKKYFPKSTDRNRVRRLVKEFFRKNLSGIGGYDIVVVPTNPSLAAKKYEHIEEKLAALFKKAKIL